MEMEMTFSQLDAGDQKLLKLMQTIDYGRLEQFSICNGHVVQPVQAEKSAPGRSAHGQYPITNHGRMEISF